MSPIRTLETRFPRLGYLSLGHQTKTKKGKIAPTVSDTIVVHAHAPELLEPFVAAYGGKVEKSLTWTEERERFLVVTDATAMPVIVPSDDMELVCSQWNEAWASSGLVRRCDGIDTVLWRKPPEKDEKIGQLSDELRPCICEAEDLDDDKRCKPTVRLNVVPIEVAAQIRGIGVWTVRSTGYFTNAELKGDLALVRSMLGHLGASVPLELSVEQVRSSRGLRPKFRLNLATTPAEAFALAEARRPAFAPPATKTLPAGEEEPVGTFIDKPTEKPLKDASEGKQESETAVAAIPAAPASSESPDDPIPAPDAVEMHGLTVRYIGGEPAKDERDRCTASQWVVINRAGQKADLGPEMVQDIFLQRHGFKGSDAKKETAQEFHNFLIEETKRLVQAAKS